MTSPSEPGFYLCKLSADAAAPVHVVQVWEHKPNDQGIPDYNWGYPGPKQEPVILGKLMHDKDAEEATALLAYYLVENDGVDEPMRITIPALPDPEVKRTNPVRRKAAPKKATKKKATATAPEQGKLGDPEE